MPPPNPQKAPPFLGQVRIFSVLLKGDFYSWFWSRQRGRAEKVGLSVSGAPALYLSPETISTTALTSLGGGKGTPKFQVTPSARRRGPQFVTEMGGVHLLIYAIICCLFQNTTSYRISFALQITPDTSVQPLRK